MTKAFYGTVGYIRYANDCVHARAGEPTAAELSCRQRTKLCREMERIGVRSARCITPGEYVPTAAVCPLRGPRMPPLPDE